MNCYLMWQKIKNFSIQFKMGTFGVMEKKRPPESEDFIDINNKDALRLLASQLNITTVKLKAAVNAAGPSKKIVEAYLKNRK
jgi:hypothetical protein